MIFRPYLLTLLISRVLAISLYLVDFNVVYGSQCSPFLVPARFPIEVSIDWSVNVSLFVAIRQARDDLLLRSSSIVLSPLLFSILYPLMAISSIQVSLDF